MRRVTLVSAVALWLGMIGLGFGAALEYTGGPGEAGPTPEVWPLAEPLSSSRMTLLLFAHPRCPCTAATVRELARLQRYIGEHTDTIAYFYVPTDEESGWTNSPLWQQASAIPGVTVRPDPDGALATQLGAMTSGHAILYAPDGQLRFSGGITPGRGHEGDSIGAQSIRAAVQGAGEHARLSSVFGCGLREVLSWP